MGDDNPNSDARTAARTRWPIVVGRHLIGAAAATIELHVYTGEVGVPWIWLAHTLVTWVIRRVEEAR